MRDVLTVQVLDAVQQLLEVAKRIAGRHADVRLDSIEQLAAASVFEEDVLDVALLTVAVAFDDVLVVKTLVDLDLPEREREREVSFGQVAHLDFIWLLVCLHNPATTTYLFQNGIQVLLVLAHIDDLGGDRVHGLVVHQQVNPVQIG